MLCQLAGGCSACPGLYRTSSAGFHSGNPRSRWRERRGCRDGTGNPTQTVLIASREITAVASDGTVELPPATKVVEAKGRFLIPGLWDTHVHLTPFGETVLRGLRNTSVRDAGSTGLTFDWRWRRGSGWDPGSGLPGE